MMTLITQLCALCAISSLMQMALPAWRTKSGIRVICGLLMIRLTLSKLHEIGGAFSQKQDLMSLFECLMR